MKSFLQTKGEMRELKGLLGEGTAEALLNTVCLNNCVHFGLRGGKVHHILL